MLVMAAGRDEAPKKGKYDYRTGRKSLTVWVSPDMIYAFKALAVEKRILQQDAITEALNDYLEKNGKSRIE